MNLLSKKKAAKLEHHLQQIAASDIQELREMWEAVKKEPAPRALSARVLRHALAWQVQSDAFGGEAAELGRSWRHIEKMRGQGADGSALLSSEPYTPQSLSNGARLVRTWRGESYEVVCVEGGYQWRGETYRSLSGIAKAITGANRNGPAFFGLREKQGAAS